MSGDVIHLRMGDISPADVRILDAESLIDQFMLTRESLLLDKEADEFIYL